MREISSFLNLEVLECLDKKYTGSRGPFSNFLRWNKINIIRLRFEKAPAVAKEETEKPLAQKKAVKKGRYLEIKL